MYEKYMLVKGKHFEINRITTCMTHYSYFHNFHSTSSELYFEKSSNMTKTIWQKWVITFFYEILTAHLLYPRVKLTCAGKYVERVKSHSWALGAGLNCRAGKLEGRVNTPRIRYDSSSGKFIKARCFAYSLRPQNLFFFAHMEFKWSALTLLQFLCTTASV